MVPTFKPLLDIIHGPAQDAREANRLGTRNSPSLLKRPVSLASPGWTSIGLFVTSMRFRRCRLLLAFDLFGLMPPEFGIDPLREEYLGKRLVRYVTTYYAARLACYTTHPSGIDNTEPFISIARCYGLATVATLGIYRSNRLAHRNDSLSLVP
jgi:hypothetical protein